jgi:rod shape-determining protein MreD
MAATYEMSRIRRLGGIGKSALTLVAIVVVQGILAYRFTVFSYFDLPLIYCVYYGFTLNRPFASVFIGSILGLLQDSLSGVPMGTNGFSKTVVCFAAASTSLKFNVDQGITRIIALFLFTLADGLLVTILGLTMGTGEGSVSGMFADRLPTLLLSGVFNTLLGLIMFGFHDRFGNAER